MAWFTSARERRLWAWALAVLAAIYLAAIFAGSLVDAIGSTTAVGVFFAVCLALTIAAVAGIALGSRARTTLWVTVGLAASFLMIPVRSGVSALERTHLFEYGLLAVLLYEAMSERRTNRATVQFPALDAILATAVLGWLDEAIQGFVPTRVYDLRDVAVNALAAVIAVTVVATIRRMRGRRAREPAGRKAPEVEVPAGPSDYRSANCPGSRGEANGSI